MGFCHNCGSPIHAEESFCANCGTKLTEDQVSEKGSNTHHQYGYVLTNIDALALKLGIPHDNVRSIINGFIEGKKGSGLIYELIDVSDYRPKLPGNEKHIKLSPVESWQTHQRLLMDNYFFDLNQRQKNVLYLFIIGGHDIIPMPSIRHYFDEDEKTIETDIPYSHLYGSQTREMLENASLFLHPQMLFAGRLPLPEDASYQMLSDYLYRAVDLSVSGLRFTTAYGQCDPHWMRVSAIVTQDLKKYNFLPEYNFSHPDYIYESLFVTPEVTMENINKFFNPQSSLYYFNMHGSNYPHQSGFTGAGLIDDIQREGVSPEQMMMADSDNIVVTEACYGARFIGKKRRESMLLSALFNKTILYLGSSRIAYGANDEVLEHISKISNADCMAAVFIHSLLCGYDAGSALYLARKEILSGKKTTLHNFTTVAEFNIFGDPSLSLGGVEEIEKTSSKSVEREALLTQPGKVGFQVKKVYDHQTEQSILSTVRQAVDNNIKEMHKIIDSYLYSHYNIRPRQLDAIYSVNYTGGGKDFMYQYDDACGKICVTTNERNEIIQVVTSKNK